MNAAELKAAFTAKLASSGIDAPTLKRLRFATRTAAEAQAAGLPYACAGFKLPYFDLGGKELEFWRFRYLEDTRKGFARVSGAKPVRYVQPKGSAPQVYIPPLLDWKAYLADSANRLVFTEGELKAACATARGIPTMGLGGVWSFKSTKARLEILPVFKSFALKDRPCIICFDSDAASNPDVRRAEVYFAEELGKLGAHITIARLPELEPGVKVGLDDYLQTHTPAELLEVLEASEPYDATAKLHAMNTEVVVVSRPGFIVRLSDKFSMSVYDFKNLHYADRFHRDYTDPAKPKVTATADAWLKWPQRGLVRALTYAPGQSEVTVDGDLNTWAGWGSEPAPGPVKLWSELLKHLLPDDLSGSRTWFEQWCAYPLQNPGFKLRSAAVMWGRQKGTGKSLVGYTLGKVYGANFAEIDDSAIDPNNAFNSWARTTQFVMADDITGHSSRRLANKLKVMVSRERIEINEKNIRQYTIPDCINYYFTANDPDAFYLDDGDRRFFIHEVTSAPKTVAFYDAYDAWYKSKDGAAALFHHLLNLDMTGFHPMQPPPITNAKLEMTALSKTELEQWVAALMLNPDDYLRKLPGDLFTPEELVAAYDPGGVKRDVSPVLMSRKLAMAGAVRVAGGAQIRSRAKQKLIRLYALRNVEKWRRSELEEARHHYDSLRYPKDSKFKDTKK
jgi:hypothetical protein